MADTPIQQFAKLPSSSKILLLAVMLVMIGAAYYTMFHGKVTEQIETAQSSKMKLETELKKAKDLQARFLALREELEARVRHADGVRSSSARRRERPLEDRRDLRVVERREHPLACREHAGDAGRYLVGIRRASAVQVAARVEAATRETGDAILVAEATKQRLTRHEVVSRGTMPLKGKSEPVELFALRALANDDRSTMARVRRMLGVRG